MRIHSRWRSMSRRRKLSNSGDDIGMGWAPPRAMASRAAPAPRMRPISACSRSTTASGVPVGAIRPSQIAAS